MVNIIHLSFRYQRGFRSLAINLQFSPGNPVVQKAVNAVTQEEEEEEYDIPGEVENVVGMCVIQRKGNRKSGYSHCSL